MSNTQLYRQLISLTPTMQQEVETYINYLKFKEVMPPAANKKRQAGLAKGMIKMLDGFDEPLDDFKEYM
jgi:Protein of unknown function (DUF2281)